MDISYLVTGNNLFSQWLCNEPIIENYKTLSGTHSIASGDFSIIKANLVNICWSYNVFQYKDEFYVTGTGAENENVVTKLDTLEKQPQATEVIVVGNDFNIFLMDVENYKIWLFKVGEIFKVSPINLVFDCPLERPQHLKVSKVIASNETIVFLTHGGHVFCGITPIYLDTSHCIGEVCDIECGYDFYVLLTTAGHVYTWGCGQRLQLGHGDIANLSIPTEVNALAGLKIAKIATGGFHSLALSEFGDVYAWGWNDDGQLGVVMESETGNGLERLISSGLPKLVDIYDDKGVQVELNIVDIACGSRHSVLKLEDNSVWASGYNKYGQLGLTLQKYPSVKTFQKVLDCDYDFKLMCGTWSTVLVVNK